MAKPAPALMQRHRIAWQTRLNYLSPSRTAVASRVVSMEPSCFALWMWSRHHRIEDRKKQIMISSRVILTKYLHVHQDSFEKSQQEGLHEVALSKIATLRENNSQVGRLYPALVFQDSFNHLTFPSSQKYINIFAQVSCSRALSDED